MQSPMYIPTYKQVTLLFVGLVLAVASIAELSHVRDASRKMVVCPGSCHIPPKNISVPVLPARTKQALLARQEGRSTPSSAIWYVWGRRIGQKRAERASRLDLPTFCEYLKNTISRSAGIRRVAAALWYLSLDADKLAQFRAQRVASYDEELEGAVAKSMAHVIEKILSKFGSFVLETDGYAGVSISRIGDTGEIRFRMQVLRTMGDVKSLSVFINGGEHGISENVWVHQAWHVLRVMFPALCNLHLGEDSVAGRKLIPSEIRSVGRCTGVAELAISSCIDAGQLKHLRGSAVSKDVDTLILQGQRLQDPDVDAIGSFSMHELSFYHTADDANNSGLARLLEHKKVAARLTKLHVVFLDNTGISTREASAIASLGSIQTLSLKAEESECKGCVARILDGTPASAELRELALAFDDLSPSDLDVVAGLGIESLQLSCRNVTDRHLSRIGTGLAGSSITRLEIGNAAADSIFRGLVAFRRLRNLRLSQYTASSDFTPDLALLLAATRQLRRLELINKNLLNPLVALVAAKSNLEELVLAVDELSESELALILTDKDKLRILEITGGSVTGYGVGVITDLYALTNLRIENAAMSYNDLVKLVSRGGLQRRLQRNFRLHIRMPWLDKQRIDVLCKYGLEYNRGAFFI